METLRWLKYLKPDGKIIYNDYKIYPMPVLSGNLEYKEKEIDQELKNLGAIKLNVLDIAESIGNIKTMNIILLGSLIKVMNLDKINWNEIITENIKEKFIDVNIQALKEGISLVSNQGDNYEL